MKKERERPASTSIAIRKPTHSVSSETLMGVSTIDRPKVEVRRPETVSIGGGEEGTAS